MLRMAELGISARDEDMYTVGMVDDMYTEKANDAEKYRYLPTQADFDRL